ncbi:MAG: hypothetical protein Q8Q32_02620 [bacterium]|nr:hypothetical protein [bacterium]
MNKFKVLGFALAIFIGGFLFVYGEYDDSPGAQLLGLLIVVSSIITLIRNKKRASK